MQARVRRLTLIVVDRTIFDQRPKVSLGHALGDGAEVGRLFDAKERAAG